MARKPKTPAEEGGVERVEQRVTKLPTKKTIIDWLKAKAEAKEAVTEINTNMAEHTRNAQKKHLDKTAADFLWKLSKLTPEKLASTMEYFFDGYEKSGLKERAESAPKFEMGEEGEKEDEHEAESPNGKGGFSQSAAQH